MITAENIMLLAQHNMVYSDTPNYWDYRVRVLTEAVTFKLSNGRIITLEKGFEWDEASIPWLFIWAFPKSGKYAYSALVHDAIYYAKYDSRKFADKEFRYWMQATLNNRLQIAVRYYIVRAFGWMYWDAKLSNRAINNQKLISIT